MAADSGALTVLTNIVWFGAPINTSGLSCALNGNRSQSHLRHISPIKLARLNLKGTIMFDLEQHRDPSKNERVEGKKAAIDLLPGLSVGDKN